MTPLPVNPKVVVLVDKNGNVVKVATNVSPDLVVLTTLNKEVFAEVALGKPFVNPEN